MLTLPASHSSTELDLAREIAERFDSAELHVFWTAHPGAPPADVPELPIFGMAVAAISAFFESLTSTLTNLGRTAARS
jgi:hypothetical protein